MRQVFKLWFKGLCLVAPAFLLGVGSANASSLVYLLGSANTSLSSLKSSDAITFDMVPSAGIKACLPKAHGRVSVVHGDVNNLMNVHVTGLVPNVDYALFVLQLPSKPFGVSWYQTDLKTNQSGEGSVIVRGIFSVETFSLSPGGPTTKFVPTHQSHLGLWFDDPVVPFKGGCELGKSSPVVTPFNGTQHAGIQVLNTSNFPDYAGPLSTIRA